MPRDPAMADAMYNRTIFHMFVKKRAVDSFAGSAIGVPMWNAGDL